MSSQEPKRKRRKNRPTDPFGGPGRQGNTISFTVVLVALAILLLVQWTNGDLGKLFNGPAAVPTLSPAGNAEPAQDEQEETAEAQATATRRPTQTPAANSSGQPRAVQTPRATIQPTPTANAPPAARASALPTIAYDELPPEAHETIALIEQGGPFPFSRDGVTFENRERLLPLKAQGYYREYTVITPGASNRGARRIVTGEAGEMYYTDDHYESFREIIR